MSAFLVATVVNQVLMYRLTRSFSVISVISVFRIRDYTGRDFNVAA